MILDKLTYKQKSRLIAAGVIILLLACYQYAFKPTFAIYSEYGLNKQKADEAENYASQYSRLHNEERELNSIIETSLTDSSNAQREILNYFGSFCKKNKLELKEYLPMPLVENKNFNIATSRIMLEGGFKNVLRLVYELENLKHFGRICSVSFTKKADPYDQKEVLISTIFLQNLIRK